MINGLSKFGFRMPAEWEKQDSIWITWPYNKRDWPGLFEYIPQTVAKIIAPISEKQKVKPKRVIKKSSEDLAAYAIEPNLNNRKTYLKIGCDLVDVNVYLDGRRVGKTPLTKRLPVSAGWHRIRIDVPGAKKFNKSGIPNPDFRDVYVTKGRTQKVTFKFLNDQEEPG